MANKPTNVSFRKKNRRECLFFEAFYQRISETKIHPKGSKGLNEKTHGTSTFLSAQISWDAAIESKRWSDHEVFVGPRNSPENKTKYDRNNV